MNYTFLTNLCVVIILTCLPCYRVNSKSIFIVSLPLSNNVDTDKTVSWERGVEILPGAFVATERLNNDSQLDVSFEVVVADSGLVTNSGYSYSGNLLEIIVTLTLQSKLADVIGIAGVLHPSMIHTLKSFQLPIASLVHFGGLVQTSTPGVSYMTASTSTVTDSIVSLMLKFNVNNMGLIIEASHSYFSQLSNELTKKVSVSLYIQITKSISLIENKFSKTSVKVVFLGASQPISLHMLCKAYKEGLTWPKYAWILLSFQLNDIDRYFDKECNTHVFDGVIILELAQVKDQHTYPPLGENAYAYVLYDVTRAFALMVVGDNQSTSDSSCKNMVCNHLLSSLTRSKVHIYQVFNGKPTPSGFYDSNLNLLTNVTIKSLIITDPHKFSSILPLPYLMVLPVLCGAFNTMLLALFFYFRNEPDVKASSISLTLIMFVGCYILVAYVIVIIVGRHINLDICMVRVSSVSLCVPLILATLLVKMLRVYHIFTIRGHEKPSKLWYNSALFIYTLLIIAPKVSVLILWSAVDVYREENIPYAHSSESLTSHEQCRSKHSIVWMTLLALYDSILSVSVVTVAIKTRKIRYARYRDTKKVNLLIFLVLFIGISTWLYWYVFTESRKYPDIPTYILYVGCITLLFACQFTLFVPKIWTPFCKKIRNWTLI